MKFTQLKFCLFKAGFHYFKVRTLFPWYLPERYCRTCASRGAVALSRILSDTSNDTNTALIEPLLFILESSKSLVRPLEKIDCDLCGRGMYGMTTHDDIKANEAGYALEAVFEVIKYEEDLHPDTRKFAKWIDYNTMEKPFECFAHFNENFAMRDEVRREL